MGDVVTLKHSTLGTVVTCDESVALNMPPEWEQIDRQAGPSSQGVSESVVETPLDPAE